MKEERRKQAKSCKKNKAKQHNRPKAVTLLKKNELPLVHVQLHCIYVRIFIELIIDFHGVSSAIYTHRRVHTLH